MLRFHRFSRLYEIVAPQYVALLDIENVTMSNAAAGLSWT